MMDLDVVGYAMLDGAIVSGVTVGVTAIGLDDKLSGMIGSLTGGKLPEKLVWALTFGGIVFAEVFILDMFLFMNND